MAQPQVQVQTWVQLSLFGNKQGPHVVQVAAPKPSPSKRTT